jgi:hypothetical protein
MNKEQLKEINRISEAIDKLENFIRYIDKNKIEKVSFRNWSDVYLSEEEAEITTRIILARRSDQLMRLKKRFEGM